VGERLVCLADGIKAPKEGRKMPAVKLLHQQSASNSKPEYIMGHSFQAVSLPARGEAGHVAAVPLVSRIHEGLVWSNRDTRTLLDKLALLLFSLAGIIDRKLLLVDLPLPRGPMIHVSPSGSSTVTPGRKPPLISMLFIAHMRSFPR
jgi:hypothetical protein